MIHPKPGKHRGLINAGLLRRHQHAGKYDVSIDDQGCASGCDARSGVDCLFVILAAMNADPDQSSAPVHSPPAPASSQPVSSPQASSPQARRRWPLRIAFAVGGMVLGALVGMAVQAAVSTTGVLGPGMDDLISEQAAGFQKLQAKMDALRNTADPAQIKSMAADLGTLLAEQEKLARRTHEELRGARAEIDRLKEHALEAAGAAGGANLWLKPGESMTIGQSGTVLSFINFGGPTSGTRTSRVAVNVAGEPKTLGVGDAAMVSSGSDTYKIIYKQTAPRADGRVGFDVVKE